MTADPALMRGAATHPCALDVDTVRFLGDLDAIERHAEDLRPTEGDDQRAKVARAAMILSEYVLGRGAA